MNKHRTVNLTLSVVCFALVWALYQQFLSALTVQGRPEPTPWIGFVSAVGVFVFLFQAAMWTAHWAVDRWLSDESRLVGDWHQVFHIHNYTKSDLPQDAIRHGTVRVAPAPGGLEITAVNRRLDGTGATSQWHSDKVSIQGNQVWLLYSSTGAGRGSTHGNMRYHQQGRVGLRKRPRKLTGQFSDSSPATHFGSIELFRCVADYEKRIEDIKKQVGLEPET